MSASRADGEPCTTAAHPRGSQPPPAARVVGRRSRCRHARVPVPWRVPPLPAESPAEGASTPYATVGVSSAAKMPKGGRSYHLLQHAAAEGERRRRSPADAEEPLRYSRRRLPEARRLGQAHRRRGG